MDIAWDMAWTRHGHDMVVTWRDMGMAFTLHFDMGMAVT